jgi:hypothetical protein
LDSGAAALAGAAIEMRLEIPAAIRTVVRSFIRVPPYESTKVCGVKVRSSAEPSLICVIYDFEPRFVMAAHSATRLPPIGLTASRLKTRTMRIIVAIIQVL